MGAFILLLTRSGHMYLLYNIFKATDETSTNSTDASDLGVTVAQQ